MKNRRPSPPYGLTADEAARRRHRESGDAWPDPRDVRFPRNAICFIHDGLDGRPRRRAQAQTDFEGHPGAGPYLCLACAEALQDEVPLRWREGT